MTLANYSCLGQRLEHSPKMAWNSPKAIAKFR